MSKINLRKGAQSIGFKILQSEYHDRRYVLIYLYKKTLEIELGQTFVKGKEIRFGINYYFTEKTLHISFYKWGKCFDFYKHNETYTTRKIIKNLFN